MRILLINNQHHLAGGAHRVYLNIAELLENKGHEVACFSTSDNETLASPFSDYFVKRMDFNKLSVLSRIYYSASYLYNKKAYKKLVKLIYDFKPDVAHIHLFYGNLSVSVIKALRDNHIPVVHSVHDYRLICPVNTFFDRENNICEKCKDKHYYHCLFRRCSKGSLFRSALVSSEAYLWKYIYKPTNLINHFIFVSEFIRRKHIEYNKLFLGKSSQIYNFSNFSIINVIPERGNYILFYGRLSVEKGLENLLKVISKTGYNLTIVGSGPLEDVVKTYSGKYANICYEGFRKGDELQKIIKNASFVIVPSEWYENNPMTVVEAFSLGKPVIASDIGGIPELVKNNITGFIFKPGNLEEMLSCLEKSQSLLDKDYYKLAANSRSFAEFNFSSEIHYNKLLMVYQNIIENEKTN